MAFWGFKRRDLFKFNWRKSLLFIFTYYILIVLTTVGTQYTTVNKVSEKEIIEKIKQISYADAALAGLEDAVFVLPILLLPQNAVIVVPAILVSSWVFAQGHQYQGEDAMKSKFLYVPIAFYFAGHYGILTTMIAHAANDLIAIAILKNIDK